MESSTFLLICSLTFRTLPFCHFSADILSTKGPVPHWQNQSEVIYLGNREQIQPRNRLNDNGIRKGDNIDRGYVKALKQELEK